MSLKRSGVQSMTTNDTPDRMTAAEYRRLKGIDDSAPVNQRGNKRPKFNNKWTLYNGRNYQSKLEANCAKALDALVRTKIIITWFPQVSIPLTDDGTMRHKVDFLVIYPDGQYEFLDAKGRDTADGKRTRRIAEKQNGIKVRLIKKPSEIYTPERV